ncbi:putative muscarinic acetylcholine receptor DM1 [Apostichopus japonicus]|uniref:Putative muscarinic acetylcholine receptor DM1 n=1 Tax=Stichopus japonicus TaxID=307972 RepID=A0A2G8L908_STIJA|nr:putative muscarinic acetylcholine receptor DM1 [Apostichopus japonicus]
METTEAYLSDVNVTTLSPGSDVIPRFSVNMTRAAIQFTIAFLVIASNLLIIIAFSVEKRLRVYTNYYIISMAIADAMLGLTGMGLSLFQNILGYRWTFGYVSCNIVLTFSHTSLHVSVLMLVVISIDRWYAYTTPLSTWHSAAGRTRSVAMSSYGLWVHLLGVILGVWGIVDDRYHNSLFCSLLSRSVIATFVAAALYYWIPTGMIAFFYFFIYRKIRSSGSNKLTTKFAANDAVRTWSSDTSNTGSMSSLSHNSTDVSVISTNNDHHDVEGKEATMGDCQHVASNQNEVILTNWKTGNVPTTTSTANAQSEILGDGLLDGLRQPHWTALRLSVL